MSDPRTPHPAASDTAPPDLETMRDTARRMQALGGPPARPQDLALLVDTLRGHVQLLVPEIQAMIRAAPSGDYAAAVALVGVDEAWRRLNTHPGFGEDAAFRHARKISLSVASLCDHWENLARP
ncbi:DUF6415 family natural product biosynthesis protein [Streptomyces sp. t39]|uniref:DUF6415 family natural product biosynthesis protein n=1 Tax=Streptomyces sp. t39 TaxID=1828156 RepID=UPI0011CD8526|nr:DUF6415 family natural product biosynthesis protein [Streptomyces sp. t39]TXS55246.1 hypothetical protein EAO77_02795 [Streptomyces sp. t39]